MTPMTWSAPWALLLLLAVPAWLVWRWRTLGQGAVPFPPLQHTRGGGATGVVLLLGVEGLLLALGVTALAGPTDVYELDLYDDAGIDLALVLDISASMQAADLPPNRLEVTKRLAQGLVTRRTGDRIGVYAFAGFCATQVPFTTDTAAVVDLLDGLSYYSILHDEKSGATAIGDALLIASDDLATLAVDGRDQLIVLVTDGESNRGVDPVLAARKLREQGVGLQVIGIGQDTPVPVFVEGKPFPRSGPQFHTKLDDTQLRQVADAAGGRYRRADSTDVLAAIFDDLTRLHQQPLQLQGVRVERSRAPLLALALAALLGVWLAFDGLWLRSPLR
jgi:Ca-activated chloride channel family protein